MLDKLSRAFAPVSLIAVSLIAVGCNSPANSNHQAAPPVISGTPSPSPSPNTTGAPTAKLNINTATDADFLRTIPNFGNKMVHEFEEYRPYNSIFQFRKEIGKYVDQNQVAEYEKYIFVPIDENQSDAATLQQIPGLDASEAQELIAGRPYASRDAFITKLGEKISSAEVETARTYLVQK